MNYQIHIADFIPTLALNLPGILRESNKSGKFR